VFGVTAATVGVDDDGVRRDGRNDRRRWSALRTSFDLIFSLSV
jgi:hypothetical protein